MNSPLRFGIGHSLMNSDTGKIKAHTSTVVALFSKMALTSQRIAMVDLVFLVFTEFLP